MFSNSGFNSDQSDSTDSSMKEPDIVKPAAKPSSNPDTGGFSLSNNHKIRYAFKNPTTYTFDHNAMNQPSLLKNSVLMTIYFDVIHWFFRNMSPDLKHTGHGPNHIQ